MSCSALYSWPLGFCSIFGAMEVRRPVQICIIQVDEEVLPSKQHNGEDNYSSRYGPAPAQTGSERLVERESGVPKTGSPVEELKLIG